MSQRKIEASQIELVAMPTSIGLSSDGLERVSNAIYGWGQAVQNAVGQSFSIKPPDTGALKQILSNYLNQSTETNGLFFIPLPTTQNAGVLSTHVYSYTNYRADSSIKNGGLRLTTEIKDSQKYTITEWNKLLNQGTNLELSSEQGKIWFLGPVSNSTITALSGNNIIFASPVLYQAQWSKTDEYSVLFAGYDRQYTKTAFFPSSQGAYLSNKVNLGSGDDVVYFDSSFSEIRGGDGENIFLPSFGSFNWALQLTVRTDGPGGGFERAVAPHPITFSRGSSVFLTNPSPPSTKYEAKDFYAFGINTYSEASKWNIQSKQVWYGNEASPKNNELNKIGGQTIIGGKDGDIFYGIDPTFYDGIPLQKLSIENLPAIEVKRYAFLNQDSNTQNQRFSVQNFETVKMFGGEGADIFYFGNPGNITVPELNRTGVAAYLVAGSHSKASKDADRKDIKWADHDNAPNTYVFNLTTSAKSYTNQSSSFDPKVGESTGPVDVAKAEWELFKKTANLFMAIGENVPYVKAITAGIEFGQAVYQLGSVFSKLVNPDPAPITTSTESLKIPVTNWKNQVIINDWAPGDSIRISVDTTYTGQKYKDAFEARWKANKFEIQSQQSSETSAAAKIVAYEGAIPTDIIQLQGFNHSDATATFGYRSYNFETAKYEWLTARHLDFFGHIAFGHEKDGINPIKNYTANNGFVFSSTQPGVVSASPNGSYVFYWNDSIGLGDKGLDDARQHSSAITIDFDSRKLGWYWQPSYKQPMTVDSNNPAAAFATLELDNANSRLWINEGPGWKFYTFDQIENEVTAMIAALRSSTFYAVTEKGALMPEAKQVANERLIKDLLLLGEYMSSLADLQQNWGNELPKIENLYEITHVKKGGDGVIVYFTKDRVVHQTVVRDVDGQPIAELPTQLLKSAVRQVEASTFVDVDTDGVIADLDEVLAVSGHAGTYAFNAYTDILERDPTTEELEIAVQMIGSIEKPAETLSELPNVQKLIQQLVLSKEFLAKSAEGPMPFVALLYEELLGVMSPDPAHVQYFVDLLNDGLAPEDVAWLFLNSDALDQVFETAEGSIEIVGAVPDPGI